MEMDFLPLKMTATTVMIAVKVANSVNSMSRHSKILFIIRRIRSFFLHDFHVFSFLKKPFQIYLLQPKPLNLFHQFLLATTIATTILKTEIVLNFIYDDKFLTLFI